MTSHTAAPMPSNRTNTPCQPPAPTIRPPSRGARIGPKPKIIITHDMGPVALVP